MKFKVYEKECPEVKIEPEKEVFFKITQLIGGGVKLVAVNENGEWISAGNILSISSEGELYRYTGVSRELGLELDHRGCIKDDD